MPITCKMCSTSNKDNAHFCATCGADLQQKVPPPSDNRSKPATVAAKTVMFVKETPSPVQLPTPVSPTGGGSPQSNNQAPMVKLNGGSTSTNKPPDVATNKTVLGAPPVNISSANPTDSPNKPAPMIQMATAKPKSAPAASQSDMSQNKTMFGMPALTAKEIEASTQAAKAAQVAKAAQAAKATGENPSKKNPTKSTKQEQSPKTTPATGLTNREPNPLESTSALAYTQNPPQGYRVDSIRPTDSRKPRISLDTWPNEKQTTPASTNTIILIATIVAGVIILGIAAFLVSKLIFSSSNNLHPKVFQAADGQNLKIVVPFADAPTGTTIQLPGLDGIIAPVSGGQAEFLLPKDRLILGENTIQLVYTEPNQSPENLTFPLVLRHTAATNLEGLAADEPYITVLFRILPSYTLTIDGKKIQTTNGIYSRKIPLASIPGSLTPSQENIAFKNIAFNLPFQLTNTDGASELGQHGIRIPVTKLQIDRPAPRAIIDDGKTTCSGVVEKDTIVTVNGISVVVTSAGFNTSVPLETYGEHKIAVVARAPGKAPTTENIEVIRIQSLRPAIKAWTTDMDKSLDFPTLARNTNAHKGKKLKMTGRIVNMNTAKGVTAFLMYIGDGCPIGAKCAVYVAFKGETSAGLQSMVDVFGTVRGTRDVDIAGGKKEKMPAMDAEFIVVKKTNKKKRSR